MGHYTFANQKVPHGQFPYRLQFAKVSDIFQAGPQHPMVLYYNRPSAMWVIAPKIGSQICLAARANGTIPEAGKRNWLGLTSTGTLAPALHTTISCRTSGCVVPTPVPTPIPFKHINGIPPCLSSCPTAKEFRTFHTCHAQVAFGKRAWGNPCSSSCSHRTLIHLRALVNLNCTGQPEWTPYPTTVPTSVPTHRCQMTHEQLGQCVEQGGCGCHKKRCILNCGESGYQRMVQQEAKHYKNVQDQREPEFWSTSALPPRPTNSCNPC